MILKGTITALVTPFKNGEVDYASLGNLVEHQITQGVEGLLACGCTGEPATLSESEKLKVISTVLEAADKRVPVIAGSGTNATQSTIDFTNKVCNLEVDAVLIITPYYNKPSPQGQLVHYSTVAEVSEKPVIIYNVPGRTGTNMGIDIIAELGEHENIIGVKDAAGSLERVTQLRKLSSMAYMSGDDHICLPQVLMGASGVVSVSSNVAPAFISQMIRFGLNGQLEKARAIHDMLYPLFKVLFIESNPAPVKKALQSLNIIASNELRLPLVAVHKQSADQIDDVLRMIEML